MTDGGGGTCVTVKACVNTSGVVDSARLKSIVVLPLYFRRRAACVLLDVSGVVLFDIV